MKIYLAILFSVLLMPIVTMANDDPVMNLQQAAANTKEALDILKMNDPEIERAIELSWNAYLQTELVYKKFDSSISEVLVEALGRLDSARSNLESIEFNDRDNAIKVSIVYLTRSYQIYEKVLEHLKTTPDPVMNLKQSAKNTKEALDILKMNDPEIERAIELSWNAYLQTKLVYKKFDSSISEVLVEALGRLDSARASLENIEFNDRDNMLKTSINYLTRSSQIFDKVLEELK